MSKRISKEKRKKLIWIFVGIIGTFLILYIAVLLNHFIFYPSYISVIGVCHPQEIFNMEKSSGVQIEILGSTQFNLATNQSTINVYNDNIRTLRHEVCHLRQAQSGRVYSCSEPIKKWFSEIECYIKENFPYDVSEFEGPN